MPPGGGGMMIKMVMVPEMVEGGAGDGDEGGGTKSLMTMVTS